MKKTILVIGLALVVGIVNISCNSRPETPEGDNALIVESAASGEINLVGNIKVTEQESGDKVFMVEGKAIILSQKTFDINHRKTYRLSVKIKTQGEQPSVTYLGVAPYDDQNRPIRVHNVTVEKDTVAELAAPYEPSDVVIKIRDGANWLAGSRRVVAFDIMDDESDLPNFNISGTTQSVEAKNGIYEVTLSKGVDKAYPAGTKVRQHFISGGYVYAKSGRVSNEWTLLEGTLKGDQLRFGTTGKLVLLCNWLPENEANIILFDELTIEEVN